MIMMSNFLKYMEVFQVCDSTFPIGSFNHSFGMENYLSNRRIKNGSEFKNWIHHYYRLQFKFGEGLLIKLIYESLNQNNFDHILDLDGSIDAGTIAKETRVGTRLIARQMGTLLTELNWEIPYLSSYFLAMQEKRAFGNPAIVFALFAHFKSIPMQEAFMMYGYSVASTLVQNAVRAVPLGQKEGQIILMSVVKELDRIYGQILCLDEFYLGANAPGIELSQIKHETQEARLFMS